MTTQTVVVQGQPLEFPSSMSREEMAAAIQSRFGQPEDLHGDMMMSLKEAPTAIADSLEQYLDSGTYESEAIPGRPETDNPLTLGANMIRPAGEAVGAVGQAGWDTWWNTYGRAFPAGTKATVEEKFGDLMEYPTALWGKLKEEYPLETAVVADAGTLAEIALPKVKIPGAGKEARRQSDTALGKEQEARRRGIFGLVRKPDSEGIIEETGTPTGRYQQWEPDTAEHNMATTLETIDSVDPNRSFTYNYREVQKAIGRWRDELWTTLGKHHNKRIQKEELVGELQAQLEDVSSIPGYHTLSGDAQAQFQNQMLEALKLIDSHGTKSLLRPRDLLKIRQEFDALFDEGVLELSTKNAKTTAGNLLRNVLGDKLRTVTGDPKVHDYLDRQHEGIKSLDVLLPKRAKEQTNMFSRAFQKLKDAGHLPSTPLALYATAATAAGFGFPAVATAAGVAGTGVAAYKTFQGLKGPARNRALAQVLRAIDAGRAKDKGFANDIAAERAIIIELLKESQREQE